MKRLQVTKEILDEVRSKFVPLVNENWGCWGELPQMPFGYTATQHDNGNGNNVVAIKVDGGIRDDDGDCYAGFKIGQGRKILPKYLSVRA